MSAIKDKEDKLQLQEEKVQELANKLRIQQAKNKEQKLAFEQARLSEPAERPETSKPCMLCHEKERQLRDIRAKTRQRKRALAQKEAGVIARAQELRRWEIQLSNREKKLAGVGDEK